MNIISLWSLITFVTYLILVVYALVTILAIIKLIKYIVTRVRLRKYIKQNINLKKYIRYINDSINMDIFFNSYTYEMYIVYCLSCIVHSIILHDKSTNLRVKQKQIYRILIRILLNKKYDRVFDEVGMKYGNYHSREQQTRLFKEIQNGRDHDRHILSDADDYLFDEKEDIPLDIAAALEDDSSEMVGEESNIDTINILDAIDDTYK